MVRMFKNWIEGRRDSLVSNVLLYKYKDLDLDHKNPHKSWVLWHPRVGEAEIGGFLQLIGQPL